MRFPSTFAAALLCASFGAMGASTGRILKLMPRASSLRSHFSHVDRLVLKSLIARSTDTMRHVEGHSI